MDTPKSQPASPPGSLPGRIYLLAYDLERRQLFDRTRTAFLTRAAVLIELAWRGQLDADGHPAATGPGTAAGTTGPDATGDLVLDRALAQIRPHRRSWKRLLRRDYRQTLDLVEQQLESAGLIRRTRHRALGLVPRYTIELLDDGPAAEAQARFTSVLRDGPAVDEVSRTDAALVALAAAGRVRTVISPADRRRYGDRITALTDRLGATSPGLASAVRGIEMTIVAARGGSG
jgi:Golgi phosphoprotein 3 (GPP34)